MFGRQALKVWRNAVTAGARPMRPDRRPPTETANACHDALSSSSSSLALLAGLPVFIALAASSLIYTHAIAGIPDFVILHRMAGGVDSFPLLAVPFFILAGNLMNSAGITNRIYDFAVAIAGWMRGGLAHVNIVGLGDLRRHVGHGHRRCRRSWHHRDQGHEGSRLLGTEFSVGVTAASSTLGPIIPPSLPFVIYGMMANVSIGALFLGGFVPGAVDDHLHDGSTSPTARASTAWAAIRRFHCACLGATFIAALPALLTPLIIIGGMTFGWFTPTEAAIAACAWAIDARASFSTDR